MLARFEGHLLHGHDFRQPVAHIVGYLAFHLGPQIPDGDRAGTRIQHHLVEGGGTVAGGVFECPVTVGGGVDPVSGPPLPVMDRPVAEQGRDLVAGQARVVVVFGAPVQGDGARTNFEPRSNSSRSTRSGDPPKPWTAAIAVSWAS